MLDELKAKGFAHPLWELTSKSNSAPIKIFNYGNGIIEACTRRFPACSRQSR